MDYEAIVLAGGGSTRLGGVDKASMSIDGCTLLDRTLEAVATAQRVVVVGDRIVPDHLVVQERPAGGGPAAAIGAGLQALSGGAAVVVVVACDMPAIASVVPILLDALAAAPNAQSMLARDDGRLQYLAGAHRVDALRSVVESRGDHQLCGGSVRALLADLQVEHVDVPSGGTADIDTWEDMRRAGATPD